MRRIKITIAYDGTEYFGWQVQTGLPTIQGAIQQVLTEIEKQEVHVTGSGRTDAGVHALAQVAAFTLKNPIPTENLKRAMNRLLPADIRVLSVEETDEKFHPRHAAISKTYQYRIWRAEICPPFKRRYLYHFPYRLDVERMAAAAPLLEGEHDFSAFAATDVKDRECRSKVRTIFESRLWLEGDHLYYEVSGSGFLKHMVRNIVGTMLEVGKGNLDGDGVRSLLQTTRIGSAGPTAPARGLFLMRVVYPPGV